MSLNFPNNPSQGNTYSIGGKTYTFNGQGWEVTSSIALTTTSVTEGNRLYFTNARVYSNVVEAGFITNGSLSGYATNNQLSLYATNNQLSSYATLSGASFSGVVTIPNLTTTGNIHSFGRYREKVFISANAFPAGNTYNIADGVVFYHTQNATANSTINIVGFTNEPVGNAISLTVLIPNGTSARYITGLTIDGTTSNVFLRWLGGTDPTGGNASNIDVYGFSVIKTDVLTYQVFATQSQFG